MLEFAHYCNTRNIGDMASGPYHYFPFPAHTVVDVNRQGPEAGSVIVIGGGAVAPHVTHAIERNPRAKVVGWGVGESRHGEKTPRPVPPGVALYGSREWNHEGAIHVPCVSCMSPLFDAPHPITRSVALFTNAGKRIMRDYPVRIEGVPVMQNDTTMEEAIEFLGSAETVLTNSYHGAYWATLLGRRVVIVNAYSSKFFGFRWQPVMASDTDWKDGVRQAVPFPEALADARAANEAFYRRVLSLIND